MSDPPAQHLSTIERFLGAEAASGGPFALLGLPVAEPGDQAVVEALQQRLERVDQSPMSETPEADEVRLALHAAAAQLMDPTQRRHMAARWRRSRKRDAPPGSLRDAAGRERSTSPTPRDPGSASEPAPPPTEPPPGAGSQRRGGSAPEHAADSDSGSGATTRPGTNGTPGAAISRQRLITLEHDAILTLAKHGGWGPRSLRELAMIAHARGINSDEVAAALNRLTHHRAPAPASAPPGAGKPGNATGRARPQPAPAQMPAPDRRVDPGGFWASLVILLIFGLGAAATSVALFMPDVWRSTLGLESRTSETSAPPAHDDRSEPDRTPQSRDGSETSADANGAATNARPTTEDAQDNSEQKRDASAPDALDDAVGLADTDPARAIQRFTVAIEQLSQSWTRLEPDELTAANAAIIEFLYRAGGEKPIARRGAEAITSLTEPLNPEGAPGPDGIAAAIWATSVLVRVSSERDLVAAAEDVLDAQLARLGFDRIGSSDRTFRAGLEGALSRAIEPLTSLGEADADGSAMWAEWAEGAALLEHISGEPADPLRLRALDALATGAPEPTERQWVHDAMTRLVKDLGWQEGDPARPWLVRAFEAPGVSTPDLAVLSGAMVRRGGPGLDPSMALGSNAADADRARLRNRYARLWNLDSASDAAAFPLELRATVERLREPGEGDAGPVDRLAAAATLALVNEAAATRWTGDVSGAMTLLDEASERVESAMETDSGGNASPLDSTTGNEWATRYLKLGQNIKGRMALLDELANSRMSGLGPMAAEVLVSEAMRGNRSAIRARAHEVLEPLTLEPNVVLGVLEMLPRMPPTDRNVALIERIAGINLPPHSDPDWERRARRAVVERALEIIAGETDLARIDRLSALIAGAYQQRARPGTGASSPGEAEEPSEAGAAHAAGSLRAGLAQSLRRGFDHPILGFSPGDVEDRRASRTALARGPVARFVSEQLAITELMALAIAWERPETSGRLRPILDQLTRRRRSAEHIFDQVHAAELAIAELWSIRLEALQ